MENHQELLSELLAVIHADGGHYEAEHGAVKSVADAIERLYAKKMDESKLRELLWLRHGCPITMLYGDDGNMQCSKCGIDFLHDSVASIESHLTQRAPDVCPADGGKHSWHPNKDNYLIYSCRKCGARG